MSATVDERIVAAKFDSSDFEKGVNKTIKKLDELKSSLDMKEATKGVKELAEKTQVSTDSMSKSLDTLTNRLTTFTGMIKQQILGGLAQEVSNVFLSMERSITSFVRSISTDQISAGMQKYESMLTSVRQMINAGYAQDDIYKVLERTRDYTDATSYSFEQMADAMSKMTAAGVDLETAGKTVEGIANACANAGVNATDASRAFFNLSQAFTKGKLDYTDFRSLELLNMTDKTLKETMLEAAVAAGTLEKRVDKLGKTVYKTTNKKDKKVKSGKTITMDNFTDMLSSTGFMTRDAMTKTFAEYYWMEVIDKDELAKMRAELGDEEFEKRFGKIASQAFSAAYEARNFKDVINAIKDAVSSGWSTTFDHLFGKLEEAKDFFTDLSNGALADVVYKIGEYRNAILGYWDTLDANGNGSGGKVFRDSILNITEALGKLFQTFLQILPGFDELGEEGEENQPVLKNLGDRLFDLTLRLRTVSKSILQAVKDFNTFMNSPLFDKADGPTRIEAIRQILANLSTVFGTFGKVVGIAMNGISRAFYTISPVIDGFLTLFTKMTEPLVALRNNDQAYKDLQNAITNVLKIVEQIVGPVGQIVGFLGDIAAFFVDMAISGVTINIQTFADVLGLLIELFGGESGQKLNDGQGVIEKMAADFESLKAACSEGVLALKQFFDTLIADLKKLFGLTGEASTEDDQNGGIFAGLMNFFETNEFVQKAKAWVNQAIVDIGTFIKSIPGRVMQFGANIYATLKSLFFTESTDETDPNQETKTVLTPLGEWLNGVIIDVKEFVVSIPTRIIQGIGTIGSWIDTLFNMLLGKDAAEEASENKTAEESPAKDKIMTEFEAFVQSTVASIKAWFDDLPNKISEAFKNIGNFFTHLWTVIDEFLFGKKVTTDLSKKKIQNETNTDFKKITYRYKTGFSKWLDTAIKEVKKFIANIPTYIKKGIQGAGDVLSTIVNALFGTQDNKEADGKEVEDRLKKPFEGLSLTSILDTIKDIGVTLVNQIAKIFTGTDDVEANQQWFSEVIANGIEWIRSNAEIALNWVLDFFANLPTNIANLFKGESESNQDQGPVGKAINNFGTTIGGFIAKIPGKVKTFVNNAITELGSLFDDLYKGISSAFSGDDGGLTDRQKAIREAALPVISFFDDLTKGVAAGFYDTKTENDRQESIANTVKQIKTTISDLFNDIYEGIVAGFTGENKTTRGEELNERQAAIAAALNSIKTFFEDICKGISAAFTGDKIDENNTTQKTVYDAVNSIKTSITTFFDDVYEGIVTAFTGSEKTTDGEDLNARQLAIKNAITSITNFFNDIYKGISAVFTDEKIDENNTTQKTVYDAVNSIKTSIAFFFDDVYKGILAAFQGDEKDPDAEELNDRQQAISAAMKSIIGFFEDIRKGITAGFDDTIKIDETNGTQTGIRDAIRSVRTAVGDFFNDVYRGIIAAFTGEEKTPEGEPLNDRQKAIKSAIESIVGFFEDVRKGIVAGFDNTVKIDETNGTQVAVRDAINTIRKAVSDFFNDVYIGVVTAFTGEEKTPKGEALNKRQEAIKSAIDAIASFFEDVCKGIDAGFTGAKIDEKNGTQVAVRDAIVKVKTSISTFFSDVYSGIIAAFSGDEKDPNAPVLTDRAEAISTAIKAIKTFFEDVYKGISAAFTGEKIDENNATQKTIYDTVTKVKESVTGFFNTIYQTITGYFKNDETTAGANGEKSDRQTAIDAAAESIGQFFVDIYEGVSKAIAGEAKGDNARQQSIIDAVNAVKEFFVGMGPTILNAIAEAFDTLGNFADVIVSYLTGDKDLGDEIQKAYGKEKPELAAAFEKIGQSLSNFFLKTIPTMIGSAVGAIAAEAPKWFGQLTDAFNKVSESKQEEAKANGTPEQSAKSMVQTLRDFFSNIFAMFSIKTAEDVIGIVAVIIAFSTLLGALKSLFSISDELEQGAQMVKWAALTVAIAAIAGILSSISTVITSGNEDDINRFERIIDKLKSLLDSLIPILAILAGKELLSMLGSIFGKDNTNSLKEIGVGGKIVEGLTGALSSFFEVLGVGAGAYVTGGLLSATLDTSMNMLSDSFTTLSSGVEDALKMIAPFITTLSDLDSQLDKAISAAGKIKTLFGTFFNSFGELYAEIAGYSMKQKVDRDQNKDDYVVTDENGNEKYHPLKEVLSVQVFLEELEQRLKLFNGLATFLDTIADALHKIQDIKSVEGEINRVTSVLTGKSFIALLTNLFIALDKAIMQSKVDPRKFGVNTGVEKVNAEMALGLDIVASSLSIFGKAISGFTESDVNALDKTLGVFTKLYQAVGSTQVESNSLYKAFLGDNSLSKIGEELKLFGLHMQSFYDYVKGIKGFSETEVAETERKTDAMLKFAVAVAKAITLSLAPNKTSSASILEDVGAKLPAFAEGVGKFFAKLDESMPNVDPKRAETLYKATETMAVLLGSLSDVVNLMLQTSNSLVTGAMGDIFEGMSTDKNIEQFTALILMVNEGIKKAISKEQFDESYKEIGKKYAEKISAGIEAAFNEDTNLAPVIKPVLDLDNAKQQLIDFFGIGTIDAFNLSEIVKSAMGANAQTDEDRITGAKLTTEIQSVVDAINAGSAKAITARDLATVFSGLKMVADSTVMAQILADPIDEMIGAKIALINQGVTPLGS